MKDSTQVKIFIGLQLNGEIKFNLNQSTTWKEANLFQNQILQLIQFEEKDYIGLYLDSPASTFEIKNQEAILKDQLKAYCPKLQIDKNKVYLFPRLFLS